MQFIQILEIFGGNNAFTNLLFLFLKSYMNVRSVINIVPNQCRLLGNARMFSAFQSSMIKCLKGGVIPDLGIILDYRMF